jgi:hypothetical protein
MCWACSMRCPNVAMAHGGVLGGDFAVIAGDWVRETGLESPVGAWMLSARC